MRSPYTVAVALLILGSQLVSASSAETTCGTCAAGYICKAGACVLDTTRLTGNPLPILTSDNPGGPIKTTGMSGTTDTATGEAQTTTASTGGATTSTGEAKTTSSGGGHSGSSPSMTSQVASTSASASLSSSSAAAAATSSGVAGSLAMEWDSWVAWGIAWAVGLPLVA